MRGGDAWTGAGDAWEGAGTWEGAVKGGGGGIYRVAATHCCICMGRREKAWVGSGMHGLWWLAGCTVNQWGGMVSAGRGEHNARTYTCTSSCCAPLSLSRPSLPTCRDAREDGRAEEGAAASGLFKHCSNQHPSPRRLSSNMALNLHKIIANQRTDKTAPKSAHNPQSFLRLERLFHPIAGRKSAHNPLKPLTIENISRAPSARLGPDIGYAFD